MVKVLDIRAVSKNMVLNKAFLIFKYFVVESFMQETLNFLQFFFQINLLLNFRHMTNHAIVIVLHQVRVTETTDLDLQLSFNNFEFCRVKSD